MSKTLSLIIPTYNMEALLPRCLDSLISEKTTARLEVLVVNDGSKDGSLAVARAFEAKHPECIKVIDKPNGNYGSTINAALPLASGTYVKILDSDDWFDTGALERYLDELDALAEPVDMSITHFRTIHDDGTQETIKYNVYGREPYEYRRVYDLDEVLAGGYIRFFLMHALTYRTELLRSSGYRQTEGISYTDTEWAAFPVFHARNIVFHDIILYQYNLAREGQTMDPAVLMKSLPQLEKVTMSMIDYYYNADTDSLSATRRAFLQQYYRNRIRIMAKCHLMDLPRDCFDAKAFEKLDADLQQAVSRMGLAQIKLYPENKIIRTDAYRYWMKYHRRLPAWVESVNHVADRVMKYLFVRIFHR